jgi:hypothetical protein
MILTTPSNTLNTFTSSSLIEIAVSIHHDLFEWDDTTSVGQDTDTFPSPDNGLIQRDSRFSHKTLSV